MAPPTHRKNNQSDDQIIMADPQKMTNHDQKVLILDDDSATVSLLCHVLENEGWQPFGVNTIEQAGAILDRHEVQAAVVDVYLGEEDGLTFVQRLRDSDNRMGIMMISAEDTSTLAMKAIQLGADDFLSKPIAPTAIRFRLEKLHELQRQRSLTHVLKEELETTVRDSAFQEIITASPEMKVVLRLIEKVSQRDLPVLVWGESGTGKELVAKAIHRLSERRRHPFVELNCAALPPNLVESELFGHEKGSFTGALSSRVGKIEQADGGTLFLDEIGELPPEVQPKILRALQEKRITRVGGREMIGSDFRLVTATNRDLVEEVKAGRFREDLFFRIAVFPIKLPPLRERGGDIPLLLEHFFHHEGLYDPQITKAAMDLLNEYNWPGNVRELRNFCQAIPLLAESGIIDETAVRSYFESRMGLNFSIRAFQAARSSPRQVRPLEEVEREEILYALRYYHGNVTQASSALGMGRATLYKYIKANNIDLEDLPSATAT